MTTRWHCAPRTAAHETKQTSGGKVMKRYEVVYRAKVREHGQAVTRLRQETYTTREAAEAFAAEDPFVTKNLVSSWQVREWMEALGDPS